MARLRRLVVPGAPHHAIVRGNNRRRLFSSVGDRLDYLRCLERGLDATGCQLHQVTLMTNHVHLIVTPQDLPAMSGLFKRTNQRYAQLRNQRLGATGKLFEERYVCNPIGDEAQLMATTLYSDANAQRAGLVGDPLAHVWSTGPLHADRPGSRIPVDLWTPSVWYLGLGATPEVRGRVYRALMAAYVQTSLAAAMDEELERDDEDDDDVKVLRPDGSSARETQTEWGSKPKKGR